MCCSIFKLINYYNSRFGLIMSESLYTMTVNRFHIAFVRRFRTDSPDPFDIIYENVINAVQWRWWPMTRNIVPVYTSAKLSNIKYCRPYEKAYRFAWKTKTQAAQNHRLFYVSESVAAGGSCTPATDRHRDRPSRERSVSLWKYNFSIPFRVLAFYNIVR